MKDSLTEIMGEENMRREFPWDGTEWNGGDRVMDVKIYTDGSAKRNPDGPGGYGAILQYTDRYGQRREKVISEGYKKTTSNRMEMMAAIAALEALRKPCRINIFTDSQYVANSINRGLVEEWKENGWVTTGKRKPVKNRELWERLLKAEEKHEVTWNWIKGHNGNAENERCDRLASDAAERPESELFDDDGKGMRMARQRKAREDPDARYATCIDCGNRWNISRDAVVPFFGYVCPKCERARKRRANIWRSRKKRISAV